MIDEFFFLIDEFFYRFANVNQKSQKQSISQKKTHLSLHIDCVFLGQNYPTRESKKIKNETKIKFMIFIILINCEIIFFCRCSRVCLIEFDENNENLVAVLG